ncbi:MAG: hypothetical protein IKG30_07290 [Clostridiales bacterium]|nr:hypothetical protein [Clostridiales bacterium]
MIAAWTFQRVVDNAGNFLLWSAPPILFLVFLVLFIVNFRKVKKENARPVKAIIFGCLAVHMLLSAIAEGLLVLILAAAISHM